MNKKKIRELIWIQKQDAEEQMERAKHKLKMLKEITAQLKKEKLI